MNQKFNKDELLATVPVMLHGPKGKVLIRAALSSGSSSTIFNWDTLVLLGYDPVAGARKRLVAGNSTEFVPVVKIEKMETLGTVKKEVKVLCSAVPQASAVDGILGMDFLKGKKLLFDFQAGMLRLEAGLFE